MGTCISTAGEGSAGAVHFLMNISIPVILLFLLFSLCILGAGDIKLFSIAGGFLTLTQLLLSDTCGVCCGGSDRSRKDRLQKVTVGYAIGTKTFMHFSTAILIGYFIVVWGGVLHKLDVAFCDTNETYGEKICCISDGT